MSDLNGKEHPEDKVNAYLSRAATIFAIVALNYSVQRMVIELFVERTKIVSLQQQVSNIFLK